MVTILLTAEDLVRLKVIQVDHDAKEALTFIQERILPEIRRHQASGMRRSLDGDGGKEG